ncbi:unnamed protein product [Absidia cylindrospora]
MYLSIIPNVVFVIINRDIRILWNEHYGSYQREATITTAITASSSPPRNTNSFTFNAPVENVNDTQNSYLTSSPSDTQTQPTQQVEQQTSQSPPSPRPTPTQQQSQQQEEDQDDQDEQQESDAAHTPTRFVKPHSNDRYIVNGTDISIMLYSFQQHISNNRLHVESHVHHLL